MRNRYKLKILIILSLLSLFTGISKITLAQSSPLDELIRYSNDVNTGVRHVETWEHDVYKGFTLTIAYAILGNPSEPLASGGMLAAVSKPIATTLENPPSIEPIRYLAHEFTPFKIKGAYAQTGRQLLSAGNFLDLWRNIRNVSYIMIILVTVVYGVMIMMRSKTDPRTVVSIQMALPQITVALVLITFSYAIGGLFIDLAGILLSLSKNILSITSWSDLNNLGMIIMGAINGITWTAPLPIVNMSDSISAQLPVVGNLPGAIGGYTLFSLFAIMILIAMINIFIALFTEWASLFIKTAVAPLLILIGSLPSTSSKSGNGFSSWIKGMAAHSISIAGMAVVLEFARRFAVSSDPNALNIQTPSIMGLRNIEKVVAFGLLLVVTAVPATVKNALDVLTPGAVTGAQQKPSDLQKSGAMIYQALPGIGPFRI